MISLEEQIEILNAGHFVEVKDNVATFCEPTGPDDLFRLYDHYPALRKMTVRCPLPFVFCGV